ncbi:hypothetical protein OS176_04300 [Xanthomonadaceae bacterium XH05]|nr:hypothetical protein [Xanthomonadaceae bacterium XH05]
MKKFLSAIAIAAASVSVSAHATELLITPNQSNAKDARATKGPRADSLALDFVSDGNTVGFQFNIPLPKDAASSQVNIKGCVSEVPAKYFSHCNIAKGHIIVQVANDNGDPIPAGVFPVGRIVLSGMTAQDLGEVKLIAADKDAEAIQSSVRIVK